MDVEKMREGRDLVSLLRDDEIGCCHQCLCGEAADEIDRLRAALDVIAGFGVVPLNSESVAGLRDIIKAMTDCAKTALADANSPEPAQRST